MRRCVARCVKRSREADEVFTATAMDGITRFGGVLRTAGKLSFFIERWFLADTFAQLLVMDALYYSGNEEYKEVSEILQNKLYYEPETLEMVLKVISTYTHQPIKYLDAIVHLSYVMLRMLEKYSKNTEYMFVRKKASKRGKKGRSVEDGEQPPFETLRCRKS